MYFRKPQKHETWKTTWGFLTDFFERIKDHAIKIDIFKFSVMLNTFYGIFEGIDHQQTILSLINKCITPMYV